LQIQYLYYLFWPLFLLVIVRLAGDALVFVIIKRSLFGFTSGGLFKEEGSAFTLIVYGSLISSSIILGDKSVVSGFFSRGLVYITEMF
jgi:hypothetical protein